MAIVYEANSDNKNYLECNMQCIEIQKEIILRIKNECHDILMKEKYKMSNLLSDLGHFHIKEYQHQKVIIILVNIY